MDDAYSGKEPQNNNGQYMQGYHRSLQLDEEEQRRKEEKELYNQLTYGKP